MTGFVRASDYHPVRYWLQEVPDKPQNFGDYLTEMLLDRLFVLPVYPADAYHLIGSVITESQMRRDLKALGIPADTGLVAFWGCGLRDAQPLSPWAMKHARFFGVRGPLSRDGLGLPQDTVLGDPGLLVPLLHSVPRRRRGVLCIVHMLDPKPDAEIQRETGADRVVRAAIPGNQAALCSFLEMIANASFVLSGALHGAIVACAYSVPFAYYDSGYVDVPFKWHDFAASVGIPCRFAKTASEGRALYQEELAPAYTPLPMVPLLAVAPFAVRHGMLLKAMHHDGHVSVAALRRLLAALREQGVDSPHLIDEAQATWLRRAYFGWADLMSATAVKLPQPSVPPGSTLLIGQTNVDRSLIVNGRLRNLASYADVLPDAVGRGHTVLFKPHPYNRTAFGLFESGIAFNAIRWTSANVYTLMADPELRKIVGISSSVLAEARYFDKQAEALAPLPFSIPDTAGQARPGQHLSIYDDCFDADFWRTILAPLLPTTGLTGQRFRRPPNTLRISLRNFWSFNEVATDFLIQVYEVGRAQK